MKRKKGELIHILLNMIF